MKGGSNWRKEPSLFTYHKSMNEWIGDALDMVCEHAQLPSLVWLFCDPMDCSPPGSSVHDFPGKNTGVGCHFLLQGIFLTQGSNLHLLSWQADSFPLSTWEVHWIWTIEQKKIQEWSWFPAYGTNWIVVCFSRVEARPRLGRTYLLLRSRKQNLENLNFPFKEGFFLSKPQNLLTASVGNKHGECPSLSKCFFNLIPS